VLDAGRQTGFVQEHAYELGIVRELVVQALDRDGSGETDRPEELPQVHRGHPSRRDGVVEGVMPNDSVAGVR
jgi:hypothetical protein